MHNNWKSISYDLPINIVLELTFCTVRRCWLRFLTSLNTDRQTGGNMCVFMQALQGLSSFFFTRVIANIGQTRLQSTFIASAWTTVFLCICKAHQYDFKQIIC